MATQQALFPGIGNVCRATEKPRIYRTCKQCQKIFRFHRIACPAGTGQFCSVACRAENTRDKTKAKLIERYGVLPLGPFRKLNLVTCSCGAIFRARTLLTQACLKCRSIKNHNNARFKYRAISGSKPSLCLICFVEFCVIDGYRQNWCSDACKAKLAKEQRRLHRQTTGKSARRRYKQRNRHQIRRAFIEDIDIAVLVQRDRGICQLCHTRVHVAKPVPHPKAPTIDHIIPISKGGSHSYQNVQLAHFQCNSKRRATGPAQQRLL